MAGIWNFLSANKDVITALVGLATLIAAVAQYFINARAERQSIQIGFLAEVERLQVVVSRHLANFRNFKDDPLIPFSTDFYDKQIENVGKISKNLVPDIIRFYGWIGFLNQVQAARKDYVAQGKLAAFDVFYVKQLESFCTQFEQLFKAHFLRYKLAPPAHHQVER